VTLLAIENFTVRYGAVEAVRDVSLTVDEGEIVTLLGANGAGKSTTLGAIVRLIPAVSGTIEFAGRDLTRLSTESVVRAGLTLAPEGRQIFPSLTVDENLTLGGVACGNRAEARRIRDEMMALFPVLAERRRQRAGTLSGGEQQQLAIARSLMSKPRLLMLDEPSLGLAPQIVEDMFDLISRLRHTGLTILLVEQNVSMALEIADRGYVLTSGAVAISGTAAELMDAEEVAQAYLGIDAA